MAEKDDNKDEFLIDEEEAKKQFLEELKNKNLEETQQIEAAKIAKALEEAQAKEAAENKAKVDLQAETSVENNIEVKKIDKSFLKKSLKASLIDTAVVALTSLASLYLFDLILRLLCGYYVADLKGVYIIVFLIMLILYPIIMQNSKFKTTIGQKFSKIAVVEREE